jgi:hypothetical protein
MGPHSLRQHENRSQVACWGPETGRAGGCVAFDTCARFSASFLCSQSQVTPWAINVSPCSCSLVCQAPWRSTYPFSVISPSCSNATLCKRQKPLSSSRGCNVPPAPCPAPATRTGTQDSLPPLEYGKGLNSRQVDRTRGGGTEQWSVRKASFPEMF